MNIFYFYQMEIAETMDKFLASRAFVNLCILPCHSFHKTGDQNKRYQTQPITAMWYCRHRSREQLSTHRCELQQGTDTRTNKRWCVYSQCHHIKFIEHLRMSHTGLPPLTHLAAISITGSSLLCCHGNRNKQW